MFVGRSISNVHFRQSHSNRSTGEVFVTFDNIEDIESALANVDREKMHGSYIKAFRSSEEQLKKCIKMKPRSDPVSMIECGVPHPKPAFDSTHLIYVKGIPWTASKQKIVQFFLSNGIRILNGTNGIHFILISSITTNNQAFVQLATEIDCQKALKVKVRFWENSTVEGELVIFARQLFSKEYNW